MVSLLACRRSATAAFTPVVRFGANSRSISRHSDQPKLTSILSRRRHFGVCYDLESGRKARAPLTRFYEPPQTFTYAHRRFSLAAVTSSIEIDISDDDDDVIDLDIDVESGAYTSTAERPIKPSPFRVTAPFAPMGDQPQAIDELVRQLENGNLDTQQFCILQGATGTGKTLVMSHVIARMGRPCLVLCHNKTLAAQVARELKSYLSENQVALFISHFDYYVPESYVEATNKYISKKSTRNVELDALRHQATRALVTREDVVAVASVSCIYGLGLPKDYLDASMTVTTGDVILWDAFIQQLEESLLYTQSENDDTFERGNYQLDVLTVAEAQLNSASGEEKLAQHRVISLWEPHESCPMTIELMPVQDDSVNTENDNNDRFVVKAMYQGGAQGHIGTDYCCILPAKHHATPRDRLENACVAIEEELRDRYDELVREGKSEAAGRLHNRVHNDLVALRDRGFCQGMENYSRHLSGRQPGEAPDTLMDFFGLNGREWLLMVDESHVTLSQLKAMYHGDRSRKQKLVKYGYRLPSALDNRPLRESEFWKQVKQAVFISATPAAQELSLAARAPVEMMIRPTYVCDPIIEVRSPHGQLDDLLEEIRIRASNGERVLAVALTKRDAEDLASYLIENDVKSTFIHSGLSTTERSNALQSLQNGQVDCLVGVNLLREGLDLPQVSLVAVLNADANGFLRSDTALLQIVGRAARNINGKSIFYAKTVTHNMKKCMDATAHRRKLQLEYNEQHGCEMRTTAGSTTLSIFDIFRDKIEAERELEVVESDFVSSELHTAPIAETVVPTNSRKISKDGSRADIETNYIPSSPGVYFWKDIDGKILYIGKAVKLRSRIRSYLSPNANHSSRIASMLRQADSVEFILTPSDRDALVLESNLIKHHQPPFNVLLKDDSHYPYICASIGDAFPRFYIAPQREDSRAANQRYRYFGPYTNFNEINTILQGIEEQFDLRAQSFKARHGSGTKEEYQELFNKALKDVFEGKKNALTAMRNEYEEAGQLFDSKYNRCCDVVAVVHDDNNSKAAIVHVLQLRDGLIAGQFSYSCDVPFGLAGVEDFSAVIQAVLMKQHYPACKESSSASFSWFPDEILMSYPAQNENELLTLIRQARQDSGSSKKKKIALRLPSVRGERKIADTRAIQLAEGNAKQVAHERSLFNVEGAAISSIDGRAADEIKKMLNLEQMPHRIECYDISHMQGDHTVGSRVVFLDGKPARDLYRRFNIKSVEGIDDYASIAEVLERRFRHVKSNDGLSNKDDPWQLPDVVLIDGGPGQLSAAIGGMSKAQVFPRNAGSKTNGHQSENRVAICALAKNKEEVFVPGKKSPVNDSPDSPGLLLLRALRDESHRFALFSHRKRRSILKGKANLRTTPVGTIKSHDAANLNGQSENAFVHYPYPLVELKN